MKEKNKISHTFAKYTSLNVLGMIGLSCYILADTFFVSWGLGVNGLTALNLAIPIYSLINGLGLMIGMGGSTRYAILKGHADKKRTDKIFTESVFFALALSLIFALCGIFLSGQLSKLLGADGETFQMTNTYLKIILIFAPMFMLNNVMLCFVRNDGSPKLAMAGMLVGSFSNIILDYILVIPCGLGMFGAAFATGLSPIISLGILSIHFIKKRNNFAFVKTELTIPKIKEISSLGVPSLITEVSSGIVMIIFNFLILKLLGNVGVAAYGVIANISLVCVSIFTGIAQGIQPIISSNYGSKNEQNIKKIYKYAVTLSLIIALFIYFITCVFANQIVAIFNKDSDALLAKIAVDGFYFYFSAFVFVGINIINAAYFSAVDRPKNAFIISILRGLVVIIPMAFLMSNLLGIVGIWLVFPLTEVVTALISLILSKKSKNKFKKLELEK